MEGTTNHIIGCNLTTCFIGCGVACFAVYCVWAFIKIYQHKHICFYSTPAGKKIDLTMIQDCIFKGGQLGISVYMALNIFYYSATGEWLLPVINASCRIIIAAGGVYALTKSITSTVNYIHEEIDRRNE
jgi:hypothetical protein